MSLWQRHCLNMNQRKIIWRTSFRALFSGTRWKWKVDLFDHRQWAFFLFGNRAVRLDIHSCKATLRGQWTAAATCTEAPWLYWNTPTGINSWTSGSYQEDQGGWLRRDARANCKVKGRHYAVVKWSAIKRAHIFSIKVNTDTLWSS